MMHPQRLAPILAMLSFTASALFAGGSYVPVGTYLYANPADKETYQGQLTIHFKTPGHRLVVAYGRKFRKDRKKRTGSKEKGREKYKPWQGKVIDDGREVIFWHLPTDKYDIVVIDDESMTVHEGVSLMRQADDQQPIQKYLDEVRGTLSPRKDIIGGWEGFFDNKNFERLETDGRRAGVFLQQMRLGVALAESGAKLKGCIHSIDIVWVERAIKEGVGWQVVSRQQLYRDEIPARTFFAHHFVKELQGIRIGRKPKEVTVALDK
ncbi:MAG: hypothetical protein KAI66_03465 [Lentisphaeria bacterium]|nr:hypothetical protein [Lentisphaeria bacterium]